MNAEETKFVRAPQIVLVIVGSIGTLIATGIAFLIVRLVEGRSAAVAVAVVTALTCIGVLAYSQWSVSRRRASRFHED